MRRSAERDILAFKKRYYHTKEGNMWISDFEQILGSVKKIDGYYLHNFDKYELMSNSWEAGFMAGHRKAVRDRDKRRNK